MSPSQFIAKAKKSGFDVLEINFGLPSSLEAEAVSGRGEKCGHRSRRAAFRGRVRRLLPLRAAVGGPGSEARCFRLDGHRPCGDRFHRSRRICLGGRPRPTRAKPITCRRRGPHAPSPRALPLRELLLAERPFGALPNRCAESHPLNRHPISRSESSLTALPSPFFFPCDLNSREQITGDSNPESFKSKRKSEGVSKRAFGAGNLIWHTGAALCRKGRVGIPGK
jgi:hypothetical protein